MKRHIVGVSAIVITTLVCSSLAFCASNRWKLTQTNLPSFAQSRLKPEVELKGDITSVVFTEGEEYHSIELIMRMVLRNRGDRPLIFLKEHFNFHGLELSSTQNYSKESVIGHSTSFMSCSGAAKWKTLRENLLKSSFPNKYAFILKPGEERQFRLKTVPVGFYLEQPSKLLADDPDKILWKEAKRVKNIWASVLLEVYPAWGLEADCGKSSFEKKLRKKWKSKGYLWATDIVSTPTRFNLRTVIDGDGR